MKKIRNAGKEIKTLSTAVGFILMIPFVAIAVLLYFLGDAMGEDFSIVSIFIVVFGIFLAWLLTVIIYGYGELIDQTMQTNYAVRDLQNMMYKKLEESNHLSEAEVALLTDIRKQLLMEK